MLAMVGWICAFAQDPAPGASNDIWLAGETSSSLHVSLTGANGDLWFGHSFADPADGLPALRVSWHDVSADSSVSNLLQSYGDLTNSGLFPSILTWPGYDNVLIVGKKDVPTQLPKLVVYTIDRDNMYSTATSEDVTSSLDVNEHSVPHLARDKQLPANHLSWSAKSATVDDAKTKVKDASTWVASTTRTLSATAFIEDHAQIAFTYSGRRYTVYHRDESDEDDPNETDPDIFLEITTWDGTTWTEVADFALTDSEDLDFPSIWIRNTSTTAEIAVVAVNNSNTAIWRCGPAAESGCDTAAEFGAPQAVTSTGSARYPQVVVVPRGTTTDTFVFVEDPGGSDPDRVRVLSLCGGTPTTFTSEGTLPYPAGYEETEQQFSGVAQYWGHGQIEWDGTEIHLAFLVEEPDETFLNVARYHVTPAALCDP